MHDPKTEELYEIKRDVIENAHGQKVEAISSNIKMTNNAMAHPMVRYKDRILECDLYSMPDGNGNHGHFMLNFYCPRCENSLRILSTRKAMSWDPNPNVQGGGYLSVEAFKCTWELGRSEATRGDRIIAGLGLCNWQVGIERNVAKDA